MLVSSCAIPLGTSPGATKVVWSGDDARIERREIKKNVFVLLAPHGGFSKNWVYGPPEYWLVENGREKLLSHVVESVAYDKEGTPDRRYKHLIFGDVSLGRWFLVAENITSKEYADIYLVLFDRNTVIKTIRIPNCKRDYSHRVLDIAQRDSLDYDSERKGVTFQSNAMNGFVSLETGQITEDINEAPEPAHTATSGVRCSLGCSVFPGRLEITICHGTILSACAKTNSVFNQAGKTSKATISATQRQEIIISQNSCDI